jgi:hypothetical protein
MDAFTETLRSWQNFYFMIGGATATLVSLMFVAVTLGVQMIPILRQTRAKTPNFSSRLVCIILSRCCCWRV